MFTLPYREPRPHGHRAPRSTELSSLDDLANKARSAADWYAGYADSLEPEKVDEVVAFSFSNGDAHPNRQAAVVESAA